MANRVRILMVNDHIHFGGGGDAVFRLERQAYERAGHDVFTFSQATEAPAETSGHDWICQVSGNRLLSKFGKFASAPDVRRLLTRLLKQIKPDLVRVHLVSKYPAEVYPALAGYPVVQTLHGSNLFCATSWGNLRTDGSDCELGIGAKCWTRGCMSLPRMALYSILDSRVRPAVKRAVGLYHCPSLHIQEKARALGFAPTMHIPLGIDSAFVRADPATHDGPPVLLYVGALIEEKGLLFLPDAMRQITQVVRDAKLVLCGRGPLEQRLRHEFARRGLTAHLDIRGFIEHSAIVDLYRGAQVFLLPSIWAEQFGLVGPEAMACGVPCVASRVGGIPEWLHHEETGFLVRPRDPDAIARRVIELLRSRDLRIRLGRTGRAYAIATHNPSKYERQWLEIAESYMLRAERRSAFPV